MTNCWILEVLVDMQHYARRNDLPKLAAQLEDTLEKAQAEITARASKTARSGEDARPSQ